MGKANAGPRQHVLSGKVVGRQSEHRPCCCSACVNEIDRDGRRVRAFAVLPLSLGHMHSSGTLGAGNSIRTALIGRVLLSCSLHLLSMRFLNIVLYSLNV
jgi:hypothetical protein